MKKFGYSLFVSLAFISCNSSNISSTSSEPDVAALASQFAQVECKAIELREQRFALADEIRYTQETLIQVSGKGDTTQLAAKLQTLNKRKEALLHASLQLASQIKDRLDSLMTKELTTAEAKAKFNSELNSALQRDCECGEPVQRTAGVGKAEAGT